LLEDVLDAAASLSTFERTGRVVPELDDALTREIFVRDFRLMYEVSSVQVLIVAFVYGARDFDSWRREREPLTATEAAHRTHP